MNDQHIPCPPARIILFCSSFFFPATSTMSATNAIRPCFTPCRRARLSCQLRPSKRCVCVKAVSEMASLCLDGQQASLIAGILKPTLAVSEFFFIMRIIMSWDPAYNTDKKLPWAIFYKPTEPVLGPTRKVIQPIGGVDISPIVWTFVLSLMNEILLGPQGILVLIERQGGL